jgi:hypothetical protein
MDIYEIMYGNSIYLYKYLKRIYFFMLSEKLHTPMVIERRYGDYDPDGLVSWSPYRASDEAARIVLPELQVSYIHLLLGSASEKQFVEHI